MTTDAHRNISSSTLSLSIPQTQNTAAVLEFNCLYTHDIRRKQKRWQDGFLRYHTFNRRVMVYDVPRNFIGDMHWTEEVDFQEGDELMLEKDAVIVQVAEQIGKTETDLSGLRKKRRVADGNSSPARKDSPSRTSEGPLLRANPVCANSPATTQAKHKSLKTLLTASRGNANKAELLKRSPFDQRRGHNENTELNGARPAKRQRIDGVTIAEDRQPYRQNLPAPRRMRSSAVENEVSNHRVARTAGMQTKKFPYLVDLTRQEDTENRDAMTTAFVSPTVKSRGWTEKKLGMHSNGRCLSAPRHSKPTPKTPDDAIPEPSEQNSGKEMGFTPIGPLSHAATGATESRGRGWMHNSPQPSCSARSMPFTTTTPSPDENRFRLRTTGTKRTLLCQGQFSTKAAEWPPLTTNNATKTLLKSPKVLEQHVHRVSGKLADTDQVTIAQDDNPDVGSGRVDGECRAIPGRKRRKEAQVKRKDILLAASASGTGAVKTITGEALVAETLDAEERNKTCSSDTERPPNALSIMADASSDKPIRKAISNTRPGRLSGAQNQPARDPCPRFAGQAITPLTMNAAPDAVTVVDDAAIVSEIVPQDKLHQNMAVGIQGRLQSEGQVSKSWEAAGTGEPYGQDVAPAPTHAGAWSREAFDLLDWRPPRWDEEAWCIKPSEA